MRRKGRPHRGTRRAREPALWTHRGPRRTHLRHLPPWLEIRSSPRRGAGALSGVEGEGMTQLPDFATNRAPSDAAATVADKVNELFCLLRANKVTAPPIA